MYPTIYMITAAEAADWSVLVASYDADIVDGEGVTHLIELCTIFFGTIL